jgi:NADP-dependent 3-hydroxy acid dehydrogenase YdfG
MANEYADKVVVITGASDGIGKALALELNQRGARLALVARSRDKLEAVAAECTDAIAIVADVTVRRDVQRALAVTMERFGQVDVWVNNAGRGISRLIEDLTDDDVDTMVRDNLKSVLYGMQTVLPTFKGQQSGVIANVSSMLGRVPFAPVRSAYSASKAGVNSLTETLRFQIADEFPDIRIVLIIPGVVATDFGLNAFRGGMDNRHLPNAQNVNEAVTAIADGLLSGPVDLYTRSGYFDLVEHHIKTLGGRS